MLLFFQNPVKNRQYLLILGDMTLALLAVFLAYWVRNSLTAEKNILWILTKQLSWKVLPTIFAQIIFLYLFELYDLDKPFYFFRTLARLVLAVGVNAGLVSVLSYLIPEYRMGKTAIVIHIPILVCLLFAWRMLLERKFRSSRSIRHILLIGADRSADVLVKELKDHPLNSYHLVGTLNNTSGGSEHKRMGVPALNGALRDVVREKGVNTIIFSSHSSLEEHQLSEALEMKYEGIQIYDLSTFYKQLTGKVPVFQTDSSWLLFSSGINVFTRSSYYTKLKRLMDISLSLSGLVQVSPFLLLAAVAIKLNSRGPVFYKQERMGLGGKEFTAVKLRTMAKDAEARTGPKWAEENDPRVTLVGKILRKTRFDEVPQLYNVLKGEMSLVGPRPIRKHFEDQAASEIPFYSLRHSVKPGITGWAQTRYHEARSEIGPLERFQYDLFYIQEASIFLDVMILLKTVQVVINKFSQ